MTYRRDERICYTRLSFAGKACHYWCPPSQPAKFSENAMPTEVNQFENRTRPEPPNVVQRLKAAIGRAEQQGFEVRKVLLDDESAGWCQVGSKKILFLDLAATTGEQLQQIDEILRSFETYRSTGQAA